MRNGMLYKASYKVISILQYIFDAKVSMSFRIDNVKLKL